MLQLLMSVAMFISRTDQIQMKRVNIKVMVNLRSISSCQKVAKCRECHPHTSHLQGVLKMGDPQVTIGFNTKSWSNESEYFT